MKKLLYKGIEFDDFQLYRETESSSGCEYGYPIDENLNTEDWEEANVYICPHCIKRHNLYAEAETDIETVEQYINGEFDDGMHSMTCSVQGCYKGNSFDCCINIAGCQIEDNEEHPTERDNGSKEDVRAYYIGKFFNCGTVEDKMKKCVEVEFLN